MKTKLLEVNKTSTSMTQLKTKIIETLKARLLVVGGLPEDATYIEISGQRLMVLSDVTGFATNKFLENYHKWIKLGKLSEITEEQWKGIVECKPYPQYSFSLPYPEYTHDIIQYRDYLEEDEPISYQKDTATEAGLSLIESECLYYLSPIIFYEAK